MLLIYNITKNNGIIMNILPIPQYNKEFNNYRISAEPGERGIRASNSRWSLLRGLIKYKGENGKNFYLNRSSAVKYIKDKSKKYELSLVQYSLKKNNLDHISNEEIPRYIGNLLQISSLLKSSNQGDVNAHYQLGALYENNNKRKSIWTISPGFSNIDKSISFYEQAGNQNHAESLFALGDICSSSHKYIHKAAQYYEKAAIHDPERAREGLERAKRNKKYYDELPLPKGYSLGQLAGFLIVAPFLPIFALASQLQVKKK